MSVSILSEGLPPLVSRFPSLPAVKTDYVKTQEILSHTEVAICRQQDIKMCETLSNYQSNLPKANPPNMSCLSSNIL